MTKRQHLLLTIALALLMLTVSPTVNAERGDKLYISLDDVLVRDRPHAQATVMLALDRGHMVVEVATYESWVKVAIARTGGIMGWLARGALTPVRPPPSAAIPRPAFEYFVSTLQRFNQGVAKQTGQGLFSRIEPITNEIIQLTATPTWLALPRQAMQQNLRVLTERWAAVNGSGFPVWIQVVDAQGNVVLRQWKAAA